MASLAFGLPVPALDTNVRRVVARARLGAESHEVPARDLRAAAGRWLDRRDPGGWNQAVMDLGREVCRPRPRCAECPLAGGCRFRRSGRAPSPPPRTQPPFEGSFRQVRGAVVRVLGRRGPVSLPALVAAAGRAQDHVAEAVRALERDGLVRTTAGLGSRTIVELA